MMKRFIIYIFLGLGYLFWSTEIYAQDNLSDIHGVIVNRQQDPQPDVSVILEENPAYKTTTGNEGEFVIPGKLGQYLLIKQAGILYKRVPIEKDSLHIIIENKKIDIGFGRIRDRDALTAAVSTIWSDDLQGQASSYINPRNMLFGKIPGLIIQDNVSGGLPPNPSFLVRGPATSKATYPSIYVDGFKWDFLRSLAPSSIESISVLKDAAALSLYGQRGADGVIFIKTKHGGNHPLRVSVSAAQTVTQPLGLPTMVDGSTYSQALTEAEKNDGISPTYSEKELGYFKTGEYPYLYPNVNWKKETLRNFGLQTNANVTFDGGNDITRYFAVLNYSHFSGIFRRPTGRYKYQGYQTRNYKPQKFFGELNLRSNLDINVTQSTLVRLQLSGFLYDMHYPSDPGGAVNRVINTPSSAFPILLPDGTFGGTQLYDNPRAEVTSVGSNHPDARQYNLNAVVKQKLDFLAKGLNLEVGFSHYDYGSFYQYYRKTYEYGSLHPIFDQTENIIDTSRAIYGENSDLKYSHHFGIQHQLHSIRAQLNYSHFFGNNRLDALLFVNQRSYDHSGVNDVRRYRKVGANIHYGIKKTYFFDVSGTYEGRNLLPKGHRFTFYPSVSASWILSNEPFLQQANFLDRLKIQASWGMVGMDHISHGQLYDYGYIYAFDHHAVQLTDNWKHIASFGLDGIPSPRDKYNTGLSHKENLGIHAFLFDHLTFMMNLYHDRRTRVMTGISGNYSNVIGMSINQTSSGIFEHKGLETELNWEGSFGEVNWYLDGQLTYTKNKVVNENEKYRPYDYMKRTGRSYGQEFGLEAIGFFKNQQDIDNSPRQEFGPVQPGDVKYRDRNDDGVINEFDIGPVGYASAYPEIYYSGSFGMAYKGFGLSFLFQGTGHQTAYLNTTSTYWPLRNHANISQFYYDHRWTPKTISTAKFPRLTTLNAPNNFRKSSLWLTDDSYLSLRYVQLSYTLPASLVDRWNIDKVKVVAMGRNLYYWSKIPIGTPEHYSGGYPQLRYYSLGLNVQF